MINIYNIENQQNNKQPKNTQEKRKEKQHMSLKLSRKNKIKTNRGITLIALVITTIFCYDEFIKSSNNNGFLLQTIQSKS